MKIQKGLLYFIAHMHGSLTIFISYYCWIAQSEVWTFSSGNGLWFSLFHDQFSHALIHSPRCIVGYQSFCLVGQELFVESTKNNFVLSDTKPNHIKTQKQIKITRYCQIRELKQDIRLVRSEESQIGFQSWVTNACDPRSNQLECVASNENVASD